MCCVSVAKRQRFLVDQGYSFKVVNELPAMNDYKGLHYSTKEDQVALLAKVMATDDSQGEEELGDSTDPFNQLTELRNKRMADDAAATSVSSGRGGWGAQRRIADSSMLTGGDDRAYAELNSSSSNVRRPAEVPKPRNILFRKRAEELRAERKQQQTHK